jgi:hypothetical protein
VGQEICGGIGSAHDIGTFLEGWNVIVGFQVSLQPKDFWFGEIGIKFCDGIAWDNSYFRSRLEMQVSRSSRHPKSNEKKEKKNEEKSDFFSGGFLFATSSEGWVHSYQERIKTVEVYFSPSENQ